MFFFMKEAKRLNNKTNSKKMKISVALCTYNGSSYIKKQIDSILCQKEHKIDEIVICDDNSTDETLEILNNYKLIHPTVFSINSNDINIGSTHNFEKALSLCTGDYIFLADQDDIWKEDKVSKTLAIFDLNPSAEGVFSNADMIDQNDNLVPSITIWDSIFFLEKELPKPVDFFDIISKNGNVVTGATLCIKNIVKDFIFPFTDDVLHDEKIASILALRNSLFYSTENLISYRIHDKQQVGMKNIHKLVSKNRLKRIILDLEKPSSFKEYRHLSKKKYLKLHKAKKYGNSNFLKINIQDLITKSRGELHLLNTKMKLKFPIRYRIIMLSDKILRKRKS
jgi:glycosyltransferase involved in cell wall biosynthesis